MLSGQPHPHRKQRLFAACPQPSTALPPSPSPRFAKKLVRVEVAPTAWPSVRASRAWAIRMSSPRQVAPGTPSRRAFAMPSGCMCRQWYTMASRNPVRKSVKSV